jgi:hypothetical protein
MSIGLAIVAWVRRWFRGIVSMPPRMPRMPLRQAAIALLAALVFANAVLGSRLLAGDQLGAPPEQLWLIAEGSVAAQLGVRAGPNGGNYIVRVSSAGTTVQAYNLPLSNGGSGRRPCAQRRRARLPRRAAVPAGSDVEIRYVVLLLAVPGDSG